MTPINSKMSSVYTYDLLGTIGHGNFSVCKLAQHKLTNQKYAIKCIDKKNLDNAQMSRIYREIDIMKSLEHPNIIKLNQVMESKSMLYLVCEYASNGEVFDYLLKHGAMSEKMACEKFCQILSAVEYCHLKNIAHRDLKTENLLFDHTMNIKLADFGFSNYFDLKNPLNTFCGSPPYAAPEIFSGKKYYGPEVDIWSLGVILYALVTASLPFDSENMQRLKSLVIASKYRIPYHISQDCENLIRHLLVANPSKRYKLQQIKAHKWIKINSSSHYYIFNKLNINEIEKINNKTNQSETQTKAKPKLKRFNRISNRFKSKSLKNISVEQSEPHSNDHLIKFHAVSYLSLPLYSYDECSNSTQPDTQIKTENMSQISSLVNCLSLNPSQISSQIDTHSQKNVTDPDPSAAIVSTQTQQLNRPYPYQHNLASHLKCKAFAKLVSNSSSLDEGVESDYSPISSSFSNDFLYSSITSCHSMQITSLESQSESSQRSFVVDEGNNENFENKITKNCGLPLPVPVPVSQALNRRQRFSCLKKSFLKANKTKNVNDLTQIRRELNSLIKTSKLTTNSSNLNKISECLSSSTATEGQNTAEVQILVPFANTSPSSNNSANIMSNGDHFKNFKQFFRNSKKKNESDINSNQLANKTCNSLTATNYVKMKRLNLNRQKSSSLNSLVDDCVANINNSNAINAKTENAIGLNSKAISKHSKFRFYRKYSLKN